MSSIRAMDLFYIYGIKAAGAYIDSNQGLLGGIQSQTETFLLAMGQCGCGRLSKFFERESSISGLMDDNSQLELGDSTPFCI